MTLRHVACHIYSEGQLTCRPTGEKYRYLRFNTDIYRDYPFRISQIIEPRTQQHRPPNEAGFGFSDPGETVIENMLTRLQSETCYIANNTNNRTFTLTEQAITELRKRDPR
jgi:hypothetical protein